jgi:hypothetical protein
MSRRVAAVVLFALAAMARPAAASDGYAAANDAYQAGDFAEAIRQYEALVAAGVQHEHLFYNLGNAYYRLASQRDDQLGSAIFNYERALRVAPGFEDASYNLGVAREAVAAKVVDRIEAAEGDPLWVSIATRLSIAQLTIGFLVLDCLLFGALVALRFLPSGFARATVMVGTVFVGVGGAVLGALLWAHVHFVSSVEVGIVLRDETQLREAAMQPARDGARVHAGLRVHVVGRESGWVRVRLANGHEGWLPQKEVGEL